MDNFQMENGVEPTDIASRYCHDNSKGTLFTKNNIVTRSNIRVRYDSRVLSFHLTKQIPMRSIFDHRCRWALEYMYTLNFEEKKMGILFADEEAVSIIHCLPLSVAKA